jgi:hypothetical protein
MEQQLALCFLAEGGVSLSRGLGKLIPTMQSTGQILEKSKDWVLSHQLTFMDPFHLASYYGPGSPRPIYYAVSP